MPYFNDLHTYLHQSSLLIQAYPSTRITTKYSLPRKPNPKAKSKSKTQSIPATTTTTTTTSEEPPTTTQPKRDPAATLTLKTFHPDSGICLKYRTDKAAEVGRLLAGLGRLAKAEVIELPVAPSNPIGTDGDKMDIDGSNAVTVEDRVVVGTPVAQQQAQAGGAGGGGAVGGGGGKGKKKKGKK